MDAAGSARLTDAIPAERAVTTTIPRSEIAEAIGDESTSPELHLQVAQLSEGGGEERSTVAIKWDRGDLERLLAQATSDSVVLTFDREELAQALADVEAHGLRTRALVFAVAVTGALGTAAGVANAMPYTEPGTGGAQSASMAMVTDASTGGYVAPAASSSADATITDASSAGGYAAAAQASSADATLTDASSAGGYVAPATGASADATLTDVSSGGGYAAPAAAASADATLTDVSSGGGYAAPAAAASADATLTDVSSGGGYVAPATGASADSTLTDVSSGGGYVAPAEAAGAGSMLTDASSGGGYVAPAQASQADSLLTDASSGGGYPAAPSGSDSSGFLDVSTPSSTDMAMTGALALAIAGAAFATRRAHKGAPRPV